MNGGRPPRARAVALTRNQEPGTAFTADDDDEDDDDSTAPFERAVGGGYTGPAMVKKWILPPDRPEEVGRLVAALRISEVTARLLVNRGLSDPAQAQ